MPELGWDIAEILEIQEKRQKTNDTPLALRNKCRNNHHNLDNYKTQHHTVRKTSNVSKGSGNNDHRN